MSYLITFEGGEGSGKTTQLHLLAKALEKDYTLSVTREPGGTPAGTRISEVLLDPTWELTDVAEVMLFNASRHCLTQQLFQQVPAGGVILCDRYIDSSLAYQGYGRQMDRALITQLNLIGCGGRLPDLTVFLDVPPRTGLRRASRRGQMNRLDLASEAFHERVYHGYHEIIAQNPERFIVVDGERCPEEVHADVHASVKTHLEKWKRTTAQSTR